MELPQSTQGSSLPQQASTAPWSHAPDAPDAPFSHFLSFGSALNNGSCAKCGGAEGDALPGLAGVLIPLVYGAVCVLGLLGNTLVIHAVLRHTRGDSVTNIYILNLAIADELLMLGLPFLAAQNALLRWPFGSPLCRVVMTVDAINQFTSIFCLTVMSVDRYLAVVHPLRSSRWRRPPVAKAVSAAVWAGSLLVALPVVAFAGVLEGRGDCSIVWPEPVEAWRTAFIVYTCSVGFFCPLLVICLCYLLILIKVRRVGKRAQAASSRRRRSERRVTRMVVVVVCVFVLCWLPFYTLNVLNLLLLLPAHLRGLYFFVVALSYANSCANPVLYGFLSHNIRRGLQRALCRPSRRVTHQDKAATEAQPATEGWGGVVLRPRGDGPARPQEEGGTGGAEEGVTSQGATRRELAGAEPQAGGRGGESGVKGVAQENSALEIS